MELMQNQLKRSISEPFELKKVINKTILAQMIKKMKIYFANGYKAFEEMIYTFEFDTATPGRIQELVEQVIL